jgi:ribosomal protein S27AE
VKIKRNYKECPKCGLSIALSVFERHIKGKRCGKPYEKFKENNCIHCNRLILNKGSLIAHMKCCVKNPNAIKFYHSPKAGLQKGNVSWNKGKTFQEKTLKRIKQQIESGDYKKLGESHIRRTVKKYLIYKNGHKCMICNLSEWQGVVIPLVADHIDGNSENNELSNFRIICNNCDSISPTFKAKNKGNGRKKRYIQNSINSSKGSNPSHSTINIK